MRPLILCLVFLSSAITAQMASAAEVTITFTGKINWATLNLDGPLAADDPITGTITYESGSAGVFTPSPNPMWVRHEMLHTDFRLGYIVG